LYRIIAYLVFSVPSFLLSLAYSRAYLYGDQVLYRNFYESLSSANIREILYLQLISTGSSEPLYGFIAWLGAQTIQDKDVFFSIVNSIFCILLFRLLLKNKASAFFVFLMFSNYYIFVLLGPAERLKVSFLFLLAAASGERFTRTLLFLGAATFSHFQTLILLAARLSGHLASFKFSRFIRLRLIVPFGLGALIVVSAMSYFLSSPFLPALLGKVEAYRGERGIESLRELSILGILALFVLKSKKAEFVLIILTLFAAAILLGPERVNMIGFVLFIYFVILERQSNHPAVLSLMGYFSVKGMFFVNAVFERGTGFG